MAKENLKLQVAIDGDNTGFTKALRKTKKDVDQFQKQQGSGLGVMDIAAANFATSKFGGGALGKKIDGIVGALSARAMSHGARSYKMRNNLNDAALISHKHRSPMAHTLSEVADHKHSVAGKQIRSAQRTSAALAMTGAGVMYLSAALKGGALSAAIAAAATAALWKMSGHGRKQAFDAGKFSSGVAMATAQKEQRDIMRQMELAGNPMHMGQQQRLITAKERREQAGAVGFGYLAGQAEIDFNNFIAALKEFTAGVLGSDDITSKGVVY